MEQQESLYKDGGSVVHDGKDESVGVSGGDGSTITIDLIYLQ